MSEEQRGRSTWKRILRTAKIFLATLVVLVAAALAIVRWRFNGKNLASFVEGQLNPDIRGRIEIESIEWPLSDLLTFREKLRVEVKGLKLFDPGGKQVLDLPQISLRVDWWALVSPFRDINDVLGDDVKVRGGWALVQEYPTPGGLEPSEIGLIAAFDSKKPPPETERTRPGMIMHFADLELVEIDLELDFIGWKVVLEDLSATGTLKNDGRDPSRTQFTYAVLPRAPRGSVDVGTLHLDLVDVQTKRFGQFADRVDAWVFDVSAKTREEARVHVVGELNDLYNPLPGSGGVILDVTVENGGGLVDRISERRVGGADLAVRAKLEGSMSAPRLAVVASGVETLLDGESIVVDKVDASVDFGTQKGTLSTLDVTALGGAAHAEGAFTLEPIGGDVGVDITREMDARRWLPPEVARLTGGTEVKGSIHATGTIDDLTGELRRVRVGGAVATGAITKRGDELRTEGFVVELPDGGASVRGRADLAKRHVRVDFDVNLRQLGRHLERFGAPRVATGVDASGTLSGGFDSFQVGARARVHGVPATGTVNLDFDYLHGPRRLDVGRLSAKPLGGALKGSARLRFGRRLEILEAKVAAAELNLANIPGLEHLGLGGRAELDLEARGTLGGDYQAEVAIGGDGLIVSGFDVGSATIRARADQNQLSLETLRVGRAGGWSVLASGRLGLIPRRFAPDRTVALELDVSSVPLAVFAPKQLALTGTASVDAKVRGTFDEPEITGKLDLGGFGFRDTLLGAAQIKLEPWPKNRLRVSGKLFQGKFAVDASVALAAPHDVAGRISFKRVEIDEFFPQLEETIPAQGWISGFIDVETARPERCAQLHITEARLQLDREDERGRPVPLVIQNGREILVDWNCVTETATLVTPIVFASGNASFTISGTAAAQKLDLEIDGTVPLGLAQFYLSRWLKQVSGTTRLDARVTGTIEQPIVEGRLAFREAKLFAHGQETPVQLPIGALKIANNGLWIEEDIHLIVGGEKLVIGGMITLDQFRPVATRLTMSGWIAGKLLAIASPRYFSDAAGAARAELVVTGPPDNLEIDGSITFDRASPLELAPRGLRQVISRIHFDRGRISFNNREIALVGVKGHLDEASFAMDGAIRLFEWSPIEVDVRAQVNGFSYNKPGVLSLEVGADVRLWGDMHELRLSPGNGPGARALQIVSGRYYQRLLLTDAFVPERTAERSEPFWKGIPVLEHLILENLRVETSGNFRIDNNIARVPLKGSIVVGGTLARTTYLGNFVAEGGTLTIPVLRVKEFTITEGAVTFSPLKPPDKTPEAVLRAEGDYIDPSGTNHRVTMEIRGEGERFNYQLWTNTGLGNAETTALILIGRTTEDVRAKVRGDASDASETDQAATAPGGGQRAAGIASAGDEIIKDLTGELLGVFIADPIRDALGGFVDTVRIGIGTDSFQAGFGKRLGRIVSLNGEYEQGYRGWSRGVFSVDIKAVDDFFFVGKYVSYNSEQETADDEDSWRFQFSFRFIVP